MTQAELFEDFASFIDVLWPLIAAGFGVSIGLALVLAIVAPFRALMGRGGGQ